MSAQWPIPRAAPSQVGVVGLARQSASQVGVAGLAHESAQQLLPLAFNEHVELIKAGAALDAFARRRAGQTVTHGHTAEADLAKPPGVLAREAKDRLHAFLDHMGPQRMNMPPARREQLLRYVESSGALLIALWDRLQVEVPDE